MTNQATEQMARDAIAAYLKHQGIDVVYLVAADGILASLAAHDPPLMIVTQSAIRAAEKSGAALAQFNEREACARLVERMTDQEPGTYPYADGPNLAGKSIAAAIRARQ